MFRRGEGTCVACANAALRPSPSPPNGIEVALGDKRVLSLRAVEGLAVLQTAEVMTSVVHGFDPLRGTSEVTSRSRTLRVLSHLAIPIAAVGEVAAALRQVVPIRTSSRASRLPVKGIPKLAP